MRCQYLSLFNLIYMHFICMCFIFPRRLFVACMSVRKAQKYLLFVSILHECKLYIRFYAYKDAVLAKMRL